MTNSNILNNSCEKTDIKAALEQRILILDGAMGTVIQSLGLTADYYHRGDFSASEVSQVGNNDLLNLTAPEIIEGIHQSYVDAGADILTTNTFSSNRISQQEYVMGEYVAAMARAGVEIARRVADRCQDRKVWVAGSLGPTSKTLSLASDINHPTERSVDFGTLSAAYYEEALALVEGGADLLLLETCFDALNAKAALYAVEQVEETLRSRNAAMKSIPLMVSATINDRSGRTLTGQTLEAFYVSISHYPILSFGLNCSFGVTELRPFVEQLARCVPCYISLYPNAGLPNEMGEYDELPDFTARHIREMACDGLLNIVGGCCGTTPHHIRAIAQAVKGMLPRHTDMVVSSLSDTTLHTSGLVVHDIVDSQSAAAQGRNVFTYVGERTNVAGSRKFARLIAEKKYEEAALVARHQIEGGAGIIDINMDDAMLDSREEMCRFLRYISNDPAVSTATLMIDSSDWPTIVEGLRNAQGKCIVNSISLKEGEEPFLQKAREIRRLGAAVVVMAFNEQGQATSYERKIAIAERAYRLLTDIGFPPHDIIFDVNILSVGTGIEEHAAYAIDFIRAVEWIKHHLPMAKTSGGVSNLSFAFRGNNKVREAMHSAFLYHAVNAGLDMAIVNPAMLQVYDDIDPDLLRAVEDVILNRDKEATERLIAIADELKSREEKRVEKKGKSADVGSDNVKADMVNNSRPSSPEERLTEALSKGISEFLPVDIPDVLYQYHGDSVAVIEGPLMRAMEHVGQLFADGKMFLPQVVKSAKVMKEAVALLTAEEATTLSTPEKADVAPSLSPPTPRTSVSHGIAPLVVLATANGDVHDIGKNIVGIVLACNHFDVRDLGVMVSNETILQAVRDLQPSLVGVSGLITPSLKEMEDLCRLFQREGVKVPLIVGGATTSAVHTAVRLAPLYDYCVAYGGDASYTSVLAKRLLADREATIQAIKAEQQQVREAYAARHHELVGSEEADKRAPQLMSPVGYVTMEELKPFERVSPSIADVEPLIDWRMFLMFWGYRGESLQQLLVNPEAEKTLKEGRQWLQRALAHGMLSLKTLLRFRNAHREGNAIILDDGCRMPMIRSQSPKGSFLSLADFFLNNEDTPIGMFCAVARPTTPSEDSKSYDALMAHALSARLAEASVAWLQQHVYGSKRVIRPAFGYPVCPDHSLKRILFDETDAERILDIRLTDHFSIQPSTTVCGLFIAHPEARYFPVGPSVIQQPSSE